MFMIELMIALMFYESKWFRLFRQSQRSTTGSKQRDKLIAQ